MQSSTSVFGDGAGRRARAFSRALLGCLATLTSAIGVADADHAPRAVSLETAMQHAATDPAGVRAAWAGLARSLAREQVARAGYAPSLQASLAGGLAFDARPVLPGPPVVRFDSTTFNASGSLSLEWTAFAPALGPTVAAAHAARDADSGAAEFTREQSIAVAAELHVRAACAQTLVDDALRSTALREQQATTIEALVAAGVRPQVDLARASIEAMATRSALSARRADAQALQAALAVAMGASPLQPLEALPGPAPRAPHAALSAHVAQAIERHPQVAELEARLEQRERELTSELRARWPSAVIALSGQLGYNDVRSGVGVSGHLYGSAATLNLRWRGDLSSWRKAEEARASVAQARALLEQTRQTLAADVTQAALAIERGDALLEQAESLGRAARVMLEAQRERYASGASSLLELLDAQALEQASRVRCIEAERDLSLAHIRLLSLTGGLEALVARSP